MIKGAIILLIIIVVVFLGMLAKLAADSRSQLPALGVNDGSLQPCPDSPNCVSSQISSSDSHYVAPLSDPDGRVWQELVQNVSTIKGATLIRTDRNYARFAFSSSVFGFVDDVEFLNQPDQGQIAVRSSSRVGYGDMNANRQRVEAIRDQLN